MPAMTLYFFLLFIAFHIMEVFFSGFSAYAWFCYIAFAVLVGMALASGTAALASVRASVLALVLALEQTVDLHIHYSLHI